ncbi:MAG: hypothetical protein IJH51_01905 [Christensenellaceae bacterium]|nr:hypothetical protein [Christensenellaceae bacterium]
MGIYDSIKPNKIGSALMKRAFDRYGRQVYTDILEKTDDRDVARQLTVQVFSDLYSGMQNKQTTDAMELLLKEYTDKRLKWLVFSEKDVGNISKEMDKDEFGAFADADGENVLRKLDKEDAAKTGDKAVEGFEDDFDEVTRRFHIKDEGKKNHHGGAIALSIIFGLIAAWFALGFLTSAGFINMPDLGWIWFSQNVYPLFRV